MLFEATHGDIRELRTPHDLIISPGHGQHRPTRLPHGYGGPLDGTRVTKMATVERHVRDGWSAALECRRP